jgi:hypothetical protein
VYLQQGKRRQALDQLVLAREKKLAFSAADLALLIDLQAASGNPYGAAETLQAALASGALPGDAGNHKKLFELWFQAREADRAKAALATAAAFSGDTELYLYLAQLQLEAQHWQAAEETLLRACSQRLADQYVSRANLLLGVSLLKQQSDTAARRAFINATLVGGANAEAAQWLRYMDAAPASEDELRREQGPCYGSRGKRAPAPTGAGGTLADPLDLADTLETVAIDTALARGYFYLEYPGTVAELLAEVEALSARLSASLVKAGGSAAGPPEVIALPGEALRLALPLRGSAQPRGRYRLYRAPAFKYVGKTLAPAGGGAAAAELEAFEAAVTAAGLRPTGERRLRLTGGASPALELQLGVQ